MGRLFRKLNSNSGNTLMMALLFMFISMVVSAVVLSGAAVAARQVKNDQSRQQAYLTLSSAAQLMRDSILDDSYKEVLTEYEPMADYLPDREDNIVREKAAKEFSKLLNDAVEYIRTFESPYLKENMAIKMNGMPTVSVRFRMETDYSILCELSIDGIEGFESRMTLSIDGTAAEIKSSGSISNEYEFTKTETIINWHDGVISKG